MHRYRIPVTQKEYEQIDRICREKHIRRATVIRMLLVEAAKMQAGKDFLEIPLKYLAIKRYEYVWTSIPEDLIGELVAQTIDLKDAQVVRLLLAWILESRRGK